MFITCVYTDSGCYFNSVGLCCVFGVVCFAGFVVLDISVVVLVRTGVFMLFTGLLCLFDCCRVACCVWFECWWFSSGCLCWAFAYRFGCIACAGCA